MKKGQSLAVASTLPDIGLLAGLIRESSRVMYARDIATYAAWTASQELPALEVVTFAR